MLIPFSSLPFPSFPFIKFRRVVFIWRVLFWKPSHIFGAQFARAGSRLLAGSVITRDFSRQNTRFPENVYDSKHFLKISDREWIERTIAQNDKDGDGGISLEEFIEMNISRNKRQNPQISVDRRSQADILQEKAKLAFNAYDRNRDGYLTKARCWKTGN